MKKISENSIILSCGRPNSCCPSVMYFDDVILGKYILIKDDFGGKVKLSIEQADMISEAVRKLVG